MSSPSVSMVMMNGVSDMADRRRDDAAGGWAPHDFLEGVEVGRENLLVAVLSLHVGAAAPARRLPRAAIGEQPPHRAGDLAGRLHCDSEPLARYHPVRIDERDDGDAAYPRLQVG